MRLAISINRLREFILSQIAQIRKGRKKVLFSKLFHLLFFLPGVFVILLVRVSRKWLHVRFGQLLSHRIGHYAANVEVYLCEYGHEKGKKRTLDMFYNCEPVCNQQLYRMWKRAIIINPLIRYLYRLTFLLPGGAKHRIEIGGIGDRDTRALMSKTQPHLSFTSSEMESGWNALSKLGISRDTPFVCFHARDPVYLSELYPDRDYSYHDYRDSNINNFVPGVEELTKRGYAALRMGSVVKERLATNEPGIIDYAASSSRSDLLDIYLSAHCRFFISTGTGMDAVPMIFRRPIVYVNFVPVEYVHSFVQDSLTIFRKYWLVAEQRFMTFREIIASGAGRFLYGDEFVRNGIELKENTPDEIKEAVIEMDERLRGSWRASEEDEELQERFWSLIPKSELNGVIKGRIGAHFLRSNRYLLEWKI